MATEDRVIDLMIIGGGVNGCGIARDAAGRGLRVCLAEMDDLASATSSASTKLFHGGLRYLEFLKIRLVREALGERETLLQAMPHIARPMRFVLPLDPEMRFERGTPVSRLLGLTMPWLRGRRPAWVIRLALFLYDHLGGREILPGTRTLDLRQDAAGAPLQPRLQRAFEYSDVWVDDARLVMLNARDAAACGAEILTRTRVERAERVGGLWQVQLRDTQTGALTTRHARALVNAAGPWVEQVIGGVIATQTAEHVRLVRGSHIIVPKLFDHDRAYFFQGPDGRIIFAIPYEGAFTLIGTTDEVHGRVEEPPACSEAEAAYLIDFANRYFAQALRPEDVVATYSGVRPLYDDGAASATAATRDYVLRLDSDGAPLLHVFGGKITTYRKLAEAALARLAPTFPGLGGDWTAGVPLPGGDFAVGEGPQRVDQLLVDYPFLTRPWAERLLRSYGTEARQVLGEARSAADLGRDFGATLTEAELRWMRQHEFARSAEDALRRRSKLYLHLSEPEKDAVSAWCAGQS